MSKQTGNPLVGVVQDACLGVYLMTKYDLNIDEETFNDIVMETKFTHVNEKPFDILRELYAIERILNFKQKPFRKFSGKTLDVTKKALKIYKDFYSKNPVRKTIVFGCFCVAWPGNEYEIREKMQLNKKLAQKGLKNVLEKINGCR